MDSSNVDYDEKVRRLREGNGLHRGGMHSLSDIPARVSPEPTPLIRPIATAEPYPIDALGPILGPAARAIAEIVMVPEAMAGNCVLGASALGAQPHANVQTFGGPKPISLNILTIEESGARKSTADSIALRPVRERALELQMNYREELRAYEAGLEAHKLRQKQIRDDVVDADDLARKLTELVEAEPPRRHFLLVGEPTIEGLILSLKDGQYGQGLFTDEGGAFIGGHAMSQEAELRTIATLSRVWDGSPIDRVRAKDREHTTLNGRRLSLHLLCQPEVASRLLGNSLYRSQGFLARFLIAAPASLIGGRILKGHPDDPYDDARVQRYWSALGTLLRRKAIEDKEVGGLAPRCISLSPEARRLIVAAHNVFETAQRQDGALASIREFASKAAEHAARIASVIALIEDPDAYEISVDGMGRALTLVQHYASEQVRLLGFAAGAPEMEAAERLLQWIRRKGLRKVTVRDVTNRGPYCIRDAKSARVALKTLMDHDWLTSDDGRTYSVSAPASALLWGDSCAT